MTSSIDSEHTKPASVLVEFRTVSAHTSSRQPQTDSVEPGQQLSREAVVHNTQACGQRALSGSMGMSLLFLAGTEFFIVLSLTELSCSHADLAMNVVHASA